jgi:diguanylate cyclase
MPGFAFIPKDDARHALQIKRFLLAAAASLMAVGVMAALYASGYMEKAGLIWSAASALACIIGFYAALRSGWSRRFRDASLTTAQMVCASFVLISSAFFISSEARYTVLPILMMTFYFGIYRMDTRAMNYMALVNVVFYGVLIVTLHLFQPSALDLWLELIRWGVLAMALFWFGTIGGHVTKLRRELARRRDAMEALLERDDLTGVGNRRFLTHMLEQEKSRAGRSGSVFCVAMLDLDYFKRVNDTYSHLAGDKVLKVFAQTAQQELRKIDYFGRYGGEEFMLIMSDTRIDGARVKAERLRQIMESTRFADIDRALVQTVSIGIAEYRRGESIEQIQLRADKAMYKAKSKGRNRIEIDAGNEFDMTIENKPTRVA